MPPEENEFDEKKRLAKEASEKSAEFAIARERIARSATVHMGEVYEKQYGAAKVEADEIALRAYILAYAGILGTSMTLTVPVLEAMLCLMSSLPIDTGLELYKQPRYNELNARISAIRNRIIRENQRKIAAANPELYTGGTSEIPKA